MPPRPVDDSTGDSTLFEKLREKSKRLVIDEVTYWVVEGDILLNEEQLRHYAQQREARQQAREAARAAQQAGLPLVGIVEPADELVGTVQEDKIVRWSPGFDLSYCILRETFKIGGEAGYQLVVDSMHKATKDWQESCGVRFVYKRELDASKERLPQGVLFTVREYDARGRFIASAFFPTDPVHRRRILIDPSFYSPELRFSKVGVLRHELGHVLGFRHEQIRSEAPPGCPDEDTYGTINLTDYDPQSVMHYFCGGVGTDSLAITEKDKIGARKVYGPPLDSFKFVE